MAKQMNWRQIDELLIQTLTDLEILHEWLFDEITKNENLTCMAIRGLRQLCDAMREAISFIHCSIISEEQIDLKSHTTLKLTKHTRKNAALLIKTLKRTRRDIETLIDLFRQKVKKNEIPKGETIKGLKGLWHNMAMVKHFLDICEGSIAQRGLGELRMLIPCFKLCPGWRRGEGFGGSDVV